jgi:ribonuclease T1
VRAGKRWRAPSRNQALLLFGVVLLTLLGAAAIVWAGIGRPPVAAPVVSASTPRSDLPTMAVGDLPPSARDTLTLIDRGGPFPYRQDGTVFANQEGRLPGRPSGYYHEYTVATPGSADRGLRRLVVGAGGDVYYTDDHYGTFRQVLR